MEFIEQQLNRKIKFDKKDDKFSETLTDDKR